MARGLSHIYLIPDILDRGESATEWSGSILEACGGRRDRLEQLPEDA